MSDGDVIRLERRIAAPPSAVFRFLTEGELWARWQGESAEIEPWSGGRFVVRMAADQVVEGKVLAIEPNARVVVSWGWRSHPRMPPGTTTVEFELLPDGDGTLLRLTHHGLPADDLPIHEAGWAMFVPRLEIAATGGDPGANPV